MEIMTFQQSFIKISLFSIYPFIRYVPRAGQTIPSYLVSNDVPYANKHSAFTFSPINSDYVLTFDDEWKYIQAHNYVPENTAKWLSVRELNGPFSPAFKMVLKNKLPVNNLAQGEKVILHIPPSAFQYAIKINGHEIRKNFPYELSNNIELTPKIQEGSNFITFACGGSADLKKFLKAIYVIVLRDMHIANLLAKGYVKPQKRYHSIGIYSKTFNFAEQPVQGYTKISSMYNENGRDLKNYLSYQTNTLTFGTVRYPFLRNTYKFHKLSLPQESDDFSGVIIPKSQKWNPEYPNVYHISEELFDDENNLVAVYSTKMGIKHIDITQGKLFVNRKKAKIKAINYVPETRWNDKKIERDLSYFKKSNINAIYISMVDINSVIVNLCNKYGIYVILDISPSNFQDDDYLATTKDVFTHVVLTYGAQPSLIALALKSTETIDPKKLYDASKIIDDILREYAMDLPLVVRTSNPELLKILKKNRLVLGLDDHSDIDVIKTAKQYDFPIIVFNQSLGDLGANPPGNRYFSTLRHGYPSNIQGLVFSSDILTDSLRMQTLKICVSGD
ncbi:MAG: hypothetical protein MI921_10895 [Cytophagales bacterium]|nr:hypothetical protein [Cytophagales bacterium]